MMISETNRARKTIKMTIQKTCISLQQQNRSNRMNFIQQTMASLQNYNKQLKHHLKTLPRSVRDKFINTFLF